MNLQICVRFQPVVTLCFDLKLENEDQDQSRLRLVRLSMGDPQSKVTPKIK